MACTCLDKVSGQLSWPFFLPTSVNPVTYDIETFGWAVKIFPKAPSGKIDYKSTRILFLNYCPICGTRLRSLEDIYQE